MSYNIDINNAIKRRREKYIKQEKGKDKHGIIDLTESLFDAFSHPGRRKTNPT